jgi:hypothetical protein
MITLPPKIAMIQSIKDLIFLRNNWYKIKKGRDLNSLTKSMMGTHSQLFPREACLGLFRKSQVFLKRSKKFAASLKLLINLKNKKVRIPLREVKNASWTVIKTTMRIQS